MNKDILFKTDDFIFSYRVGGVLIRNGMILLQKPPKDDYAIIGGHVSSMETTRQTLIREYKEELHADINVDKLFAIGEIFFPWGKKPCHQIGLYYQISLKNAGSIPQSGVFRGYDDFDNTRMDLDFCWVPLAELTNIKLYPCELISAILNQSNEILHFVSNQL